MTSNKSSLEPPGLSPESTTGQAFGQAFGQAEPTEQPDPPKHSRRTILAAVGAFALLGTATTVLGGSLLNPPSSTEDGDFSGETLEFLIPLASGGGTDTWARFIGTELTNYVPGRPGFAPVNEAGGEGILGTNRFARSAKTDGTEILVGTASTVVPWVLGRSAVKYSFEDLKPVVVNGTGGVIYARAEAGVAGVQDLINRDRPLEFGGISATGLDITTLVAFDLLEADVTSTFGFEGRGPVNLALQRGEIDLDYQTTSAYGSAVAGIVKEGKAVVLMSFGQLNDAGDVVRDPNFPDVPTVAEAYETLHGKKPAGEKFEAYKTLLGLTYTYQKGLWVPEETPGKAYELLRQSSEKLGTDRGFQEKASKVLGGYPLVADTGVADRVRDAYTVSSSVRSYVTGLLASKYNIHVE
ncbi:tripartite tricarboxylate transporter substrate-binding protein [Arthrobacter sp. B10-11]|uniref:tripartite tricarboxylate transporter substrate-binding protein n=1 Tax=Arthrobacter sp. B10-11 TaxID=3081160 RepID=UPI002954A820|nr:tripartite tricarboxylate transporter substrate-binding protein [Arthrobacter sp. B10-11]MDV8147810.1 tripartite tricarboxylate transporter substrate-binding protein [Arthrobacter sp. B10-11]